MNYVIHLAIRSVSSKDEEDGHNTDRQYVLQYKQHNLGFVGRKALNNVKFNIAIFSCVHLCLSVALKFLKHVSECYKSWCKHYDDLGDTH
jgi:hypothetical protein